MELRRSVSRILQLHAPGYGTCFHCGWPWVFVETEHTLRLGSSGAFPVCEPCYQFLRYTEGTPEARERYIGFYRSLVLSWKGMDPTDKVDYLPEMLAAIDKEWPVP